MIVADPLPAETIQSRTPTKQQLKIGKILVEAITNNDIDKVKQLLPSVDSQMMDDFGDTIFCLASFKGRLEIIKLLMGKKLFDANQTYIGKLMQSFIRLLQSI